MMVAIKLMMDELKTTIIIIKIMTKTFLQVVVGTLMQCIFLFFSQTGFLTGKHACFFSTWSGVSSRCGVGEKGQETLRTDRQIHRQTELLRRLGPCRQTDRQTYRRKEKTDWWNWDLADLLLDRQLEGGAHWAGQIEANLVEWILRELILWESMMGVIVIE